MPFETPPVLRSEVRGVIIRSAPQTDQILTPAKGKADAARHDRVVETDT